MLAVVRLIGDQDVEVTAQHASSTSTAVTVRIGRALLYLNDQATAAHFHKVWFDAAAHARTLPPVGHPAHRGLVRALRGMPEPGIVANAAARPACSVAMVGGEPPDASRSFGSSSAGSPSRSATSPPTAPAWARSARPTTWPATCSCPPAAHGSTTARSPPPATPSTPTHPQRPRSAGGPAGYGRGRRVAKVDRRGAPVPPGSTPPHARQPGYRRSRDPPAQANDAAVAGEGSRPT